MRFSALKLQALGDGLMAAFELPAAGMQSALAMHEALDELVTRGNEHGASAGLRGLRLQVALACGEVVEMGGDCFGDAVNVAARLIDHAGDNETLITVEVMQEVCTRLNPGAISRTYAPNGRMKIKAAAVPGRLLEHS